MARSRLALGLSCVLGLLGPSSHASEASGVAPTAIRNAQLVMRGIAGPLSQAVRDEGRGLSWLAYRVPSTGRGHMCCFDSPRASKGGRGGCCRLEDGRTGELRDGAGPIPLAAADVNAAHILLRVLDGRVDRIGVYSPDCVLDAGGARVGWLTGVTPAESLGVLEALAGRGLDLADEALAAIAAHADSEADAVLERQAAPGRPAKLREQAAFWMGEARGRRGFEALRRLLRAGDEGRFREQVVFALSQSDVPEALDTLIATAGADRDRDVRGQALFWLAQKAGRRAAETITRAIQDDPDTEVKKKAVFALSEMEDGVPLLIQVARDNRNPAVREQAFFWLGQSKDPKALAFLTQVLQR